MPSTVVKDHSEPSASKKNHKKKHLHHGDIDSTEDEVCTTMPTQKTHKKHHQKKQSHQKKSESAPIIPVTLLSGFLGAGKTTLLKHILESNNHQRRIAVIVNDMASLNIDASFISKTGFIQSEEEFITMQNGCICCTLRADLLKAIQKIQSMKTFDYIVIESTGISEPMQVAETFCIDPDTVELASKEEQMLFHNTARLDTCVTVIDAFEFPHLIESVESFVEKFPGEKTSAATNVTGDAEESKKIAQLLIEQVEFANVILLNKMDLITAEKKEEVLKLVHTLNPKAKVIPTTYSKVSLDEIIDTKLFNMEDASTAAGWLQSLSSLKKDTSLSTIKSERDEYDVYSFVYQARKPFHPFRLHRFVEQHFYFANNWSRNPHARPALSCNHKYGQLLRSKGFCWIASQNQSMVEWNHNGRILSLIPSMSWYVDVPEAEWNVFSEDEKIVIRKDILPDNPHGDRRQEIVFIGVKLQESHLREALDACLLTDDEFQRFHHTIPQNFYDPLPIWTTEIVEPSTLAFVIRKDEQANFVIGKEMMVDLTQATINLRTYDEQEGIIDIKSLEYADYDLTKLTVKLWLDKKFGDLCSSSSLLCVLRPFQLDQFAIDATLLPESEENDELSFCLRVEIEYVESTMISRFLHNQKRRKSNNDEAMEVLFQMVEVHIMGVSRTQEVEEDEDGEDEHEHDDSDEHSHKH